ncbi:MAG: HypX (modular protein) [Symploca sp. SIO1C4]|uniref:HypX (Modular protein) n=1 Tax=Symploca sp. SIO1C4 TaxID=2607765 RepID=A0A6B3NDT8_9CYAN|nr:HypX (modular protein) [Symploca sp. SIO1C4]
MSKQNRQSDTTNSSPTTASTESQETQTSRRRSSEDQNRDKSVYKYLLHCFTDLGISENEGKKKPNESSIANQWGQKSNRIFIRRVLRSVLPEYYDEYEQGSVKTVPGLTLGKLVEIIVSIQNYWIEQRRNKKNEQVSHILTRKEKLSILRKFSQLSLEEKNKLDLDTSLQSTEMLLQLLLEIVTNKNNDLNDEDIIVFYKSAISSYQSLRRAKIDNSQKLQIDSTDFLIKKHLEVLLEEHARGLDYEPKQEKIDELFRKVKKQISRIEFQSGIRQNKSFLANDTSTNDLQDDPYSFSQTLIEHLINSVVENSLLADEFPVYLKYFEIRKVRPLPLYVNTGDQKIGLLNPMLLREDENQEDIEGLERQFAYKVKVHFYVMLPNNYQTRFAEKSWDISSFMKNHRLEFFEESMGIGSPISHIIAVINRVLLWDIPGLSEYFPVAQEILTDDQVLSEISHDSIWSRSMVRLCKKSEITTAINKNKKYTEVANDQEIASGQYCGFDLVEVAAKAALCARLKAIKQTGINPIDYLTQLCHRAEELNALKRAENYLKFYPFSLKAMEGYLKQTILKGHPTVDNQGKVQEIDDEKPWNLVVYDAYLKITEAYLQEGLYRVAKKYLDIIKDQIEKSDKNFLDDLILAKYKLCQFRYHYLTDTGDDDSEYYQNYDRRNAVDKAARSLNEAETYLKEALKKYHTISEYAQSNYHPFFYLLSRVYAHRAKLYLFMPDYTDRPGGKWEILTEPIRLLEKARIYAARDGSAAEYAYWCAYQSWSYVRVAYLGDSERVKSGFSRKECIDWAKRLIDHAHICYSYTGKQCYQQIKDNAGKITKFHKHGKYYEKYHDIEIQVIPLIKELEKDTRENTDEYQQNYNSDQDLLILDLSLLKRTTNNYQHRPTYLFGTHASIILFAMGMLELCEDESNQDKLNKKIEKAITIFDYCSAIAQDGNTTKNEEGVFVLDRIFDQDKTQYSKNYLLTGLYPHRLTQFADLGKVFAATCKSILLVYQSNPNWEEIDHILSGLHHNMSRNSN